MTPEQRINEIRKELLLNERLTTLLVEEAKHYADASLRKSYSTNDAALLIRQAGLAEGVEKFVSLITKPPVAAQK